jgi:hypothetical protein
MTKQYQFAVMGPTAWGPDKKGIVSRHMTLKAAQKALKLAKGSEGFEIVELKNEAAH